MDSTSPPPLLVIFDIDGVLIDFEHLNKGYRTSTLTGFGLTKDQAELGVTIWDDLIRRGHDRRNVEGLTIAIARQFGVPITTSRLKDAFEARRHFLENGLQAIPGMVELVRRLQAQPERYLLGIASTGEPWKQLSKLDQVGLKDMFPANSIIIYHSSDSRAKPNGLSITEVMDAHRRLGHAVDTKRVVMIGDRQVDIDAGVDAEAMTILFTTGSPEKSGSPKKSGGVIPNYVASSVGQLETVIERLYVSLNRGLAAGIA